MDNLSVKQGATLPITVEINASEQAQTARIILRKSLQDAVAYVGNASFVGNVADLTIPATATDGLDVATYLYQVSVYYAGTPTPVDKFPNDDDCEGDCEFPTIQVCAKLDPEVS